MRLSCAFRASMRGIVSCGMRGLCRVCTGPRKRTHKSSSVHTLFLYTTLHLYTHSRKCTHMARVDVRVPDVDLLAWKERAATAGLSLSDWIRWKCAEVKTIPDVPQARRVRGATRRNADSPGAIGLPEPSSDHGVDSKTPANPIERLPVLGEKPAVRKGAKTCVHGRAQGYRCWQCGGKANVQS